jgi:UDP-N-acetylmuramoyl-tripeptide--D-alanyl-D-alanine ligase
MQQWPASVTRPGTTPIPAADQPAFDALSLAAAVAGRVVREADLPIRGGAVDSRRVEPGNAFFALPGERTDGHEFLAEAAQRGAAAFVVSRLPIDSDLPAGPSVIVVADTLAALGAAAGAWRTRFDPLVVGVTGSLAKTSTKEQIAEVLSEGWGDSHVLRNNANENNEIGLPLTLLRVDGAHDVAVLEMGMYVPGDIAMLAALARPRIGVVTAVRGTHLARAGSIDAIEGGKRELVEALPAGGTAVLNVDDPRVDRMADAMRADVGVIRYGFDSRADVTATNVESLAERGMRFHLRARGEEVEALSPALGRHGVHNALAGAAVGLAAGLDLATIARGLARPYSAPHRSTLLDLGDWRVLDDTYNAGPDSMAAALDLLASLPGRRIAVLGEMLELGELSEEAHRGVGAHAARTADVLIAVGPTASDYAAGARAGGMSSASIHETADREAATALLLNELRPADVVLLKASRGAELDLLLAPLREASRTGGHA